jgi:hypothetical protein
MTIVAVGLLKKMTGEGSDPVGLELGSIGLELEG